MKKPKIKVGQVWYDEKLDHLVLVYNEMSIAWDESELIFAVSPMGGGTTSIFVACLNIGLYNFKDGNWHYIGEL